MVLVVLRNKRPLRNRDRHIIRQRMARYHDAGRMRRRMARQPLNFAGQIDKAFDIRIALIGLTEVRGLLQSLVERDFQLIGYELGNFRNFGIRQIEYAADIADGTFRGHCAKRDNLSDMVVAIALLDIVDDLAALDIVEIDIDIRHRHAFRIQKTFEEQIVLQWIKIRDSQQIRDDAACRRATAWSNADAVLARIIDEIPDNQKVAVVPHAVNDTELVFQTFAHFVRDFRIAAQQIFLTEIAKIGLIVFIRCGNRVIRQLQMAEFKVNLTTRGYFSCIFDGFGTVLEKCGHFLRRLEVVIIT